MSTKTQHELLYEARDLLESLLREQADALLPTFAALGAGVLKVDLLAQRAHLSDGTLLHDFARELSRLFLERLSKEASEVLIDARIRCRVSTREVRTACVAKSTNGDAFVTRRLFTVCAVRGKSIVQSKKLRVWSADPWEVERRWLTPNSRLQPTQTAAPSS